MKRPLYSVNQGITLTRTALNLGRVPRDLGVYP